MHLVFYGYTAWRNGGRNGNRITSRAAPVDGRWVSSGRPGLLHANISATDEMESLGTPTSST